MDILKRISRHSFIYGFGNILSRMIGFIMIPVYTRYLLPADYGVIELIDLITFVAVRVSGVGMGATLIRFYCESKNKKEQDQVVSGALAFVVLTELLTFCLLLRFSEGISVLVFKSPAYSNYIQLVSATVGLVVFNDLVLCYFRAKQQSATYVSCSLGRLALGLLLNVYLVVLLTRGVWGVVYSGLLSNCIAAVFLSIIIFWEVHFSFSWLKLKAMIRYGIPLIPASLGMFTLTFADRFFLQRYAALSDVGLYSLGYKIGMTMNALVVSPFLLMWGSYLYEIAKREDAKEIFAQVQFYFFGFYIFLSLGLAIFANEIVRYFCAPEYWRAAQIVPLIVLSYVFSALYYFFNIGVLITMRTDYLAYVTGLSAVGNIALNYLLVPPYGVLGAAWATTLSFAFMAGVVLLVSHRFYPVPYKYKELMTMSIIALTVFAGAQTAVYYPGRGVMLIKTLLLISFPVLLWILGGCGEREKKEVRKFADRWMERVSGVMSRS